MELRSKGIKSEVKRMRIISLVPSWTETLIAAGHSPVGRTRYCVHPAHDVAQIPIVGGTKTVDWNRVRELKPDLLILDQEENPKSFSEQGLPFWSSRVVDGQSLAEGFRGLAERLHSKNLESLAYDMDTIVKAPPGSFEPHRLPGVLEVLRPWDGCEAISYVIWKDPWMGVNPQTYIGFVLGKLGIQLKTWEPNEQRYPEIEMKPDEDHVYLFSSEPYPFFKKRKDIQNLGVKGAFVDGEVFSWYGVRSLNFLKKALQR